MPSECLGEGEYNAVVKRRRTPKRRGDTLGELKLLYGGWGRQLNSTSSASSTVPISGEGAGECCEILNNIEPLRDELHLYRNDEQVWLGPILSVKGDPEAGTAAITARDLSQWLYWRVFLHTMQPKDIELAEIFAGYFGYLMRGELPPWGLMQDGDPELPGMYADDPGLELETLPTGVTGTRTVYHHDLKIGGPEMEELARTGVDWTVANRRMWAGGLSIVTATGQPAFTPSLLTDDGFRTKPAVRRTGESMGTHVLVRANGFRGNVGGADPEDGLLVQRVLDEYSIEDQNSADAAALTYHERGHKPLVFVEGNNALDPSAPIDVQELVPGLLQRVDVTGGGCVEHRGRLRLEQLEANFNAETGEEITVTMQPEGTSGDARGAG